VHGKYVIPGVVISRTRAFLAARTRTNVQLECDTWNENNPSSLVLHVKAVTGSSFFTYFHMTVCVTPPGRATDVNLKPGRYHGTGEPHCHAGSACRPGRSVPQGRGAYLGCNVAVVGQPLDSKQTATPSGRTRNPHGVTLSRAFSSWNRCWWSVDDRGFDRFTDRTLLYRTSWVAVVKGLRSVGFGRKPGTQRLRWRTWLQI